MGRELRAFQPDHRERSWESRLPAAKRRFREIFPAGFRDPTYLDWERGYKWAAHLAWQRELDRTTWARLLAAKEYTEISRRIASFYAGSKLNMIAMYEWMALREALADKGGALLLSIGFYYLVHGTGRFGSRLERVTAILDPAPHPQPRLAKWPVATLLPFVARPASYLILKPMVMKRAAERLGFDLMYAS